MCGIVGLIGFPARQSKPLLNKMLISITHRGPDDQGVYFNKNVGFGHQRLSILDLSSLGHQPMSTPDNNLVIVFNGEIYNYEAIRKKLSQSGYQFRSDTDTEVLLYAYQKWGIDFLSKLNGMFAFAIYNKAKQTILLARDRLGIKPLYFSSLSDNRLVFASEIRAITKSGIVAPKLNESLLPTFLKYQTVPPPQTLIDGIEMLAPGHYLLKTESGVKQNKYWDVRYPKSITKIEKNTPQKNVRDLLESAVEERLISDVPLGAFLSGGIDSSLIVAIMSRQKDKAVKTFTVAFENKKFKDGVYARKVADVFKTDHSEVLINQSDLLCMIPDAIGAQDHPSADGINTFIVSKAAKDSGLTVVLSGLGSDELFAGYPGFKRIFQQQKNQLLWNLFPKKLRLHLGKFIENRAPSVKMNKLAQMIQTNGSIAQIYPLSRQVYAPSQIKNLLNSNIRHKEFDPYSNLLSTNLLEYNQNSEQIISQISYAELNTYMHDILLRDTDQMSMASSLEVRVPFLDHHLVEYVLSLKDKQKFRNNQQKSLLVTAFEDILPQEVINRPKQGFIMPFEDWMRGPLKKLSEEHLSTLSNLSIFREQSIQSLWSDFLSGSRQVSWSRLWLLVVLGAWCKKNQIE